MLSDLIDVRQLLGCDRDWRLMPTVRTELERHHRKIARFAAWGVAVSMVGMVLAPAVLASFGATS
jgi:hypothetical protein